MNLIYFYLLFWITCAACYKVTNQVDFEKNCDVQMQVSDSTIVEVFAYPQAGVLPETSSCQAKFVATPSDRKLRIYVHEFFLGPGACGHKMKIYDGDRFQNDPKWELSCNTPLTTYTSSSNFVILSFIKPSVDTSQLYKFNIKITTDQDEPTLLFEALKTPDEHKLKWPAYRILQHRKRRQTENKPSYTDALTGDGGSSGGGLTSGAIAGIAVGGVVGAVIIIAICIYALWKFMRQSEEKRRYGANEPPPVFVTPEQPLSNCGIAPGSSRRSFRSHSHVAFSDVSKKSEKDSISSDGISKSRSSKSYDNHGFSNDGTSVASSNIKGEQAKDVKSHNSTDQNNRSNQEEFSRDKKSRRSYRNDREEENINYPDVVDSARKSEKEKYHDNLSSKETRSRGDSVRKTEREGNKHKERSDSVKKNEKERDRHRDRIESRGRDREMSKRHKSRDDEDDDSDDKGRGRYTHRDDMKHKHDKYNNEHRSTTGHRHKTESVHTDDSGATYLSSVSDRYHDRQNRQNDRYDDRRYRDDQYDDRKYRDDRYDDRRYRDDRYDDHRKRDNRHTSERSSSQRRGRTDSHRRHKDVDDIENEGMRSRRGDQGKQRSNSTSRMRSSNNKQSSDHDRYRDSYGDQRGRHNNERESGLKRQDSSRSQGGRHRSRSSYR